MSEFWLGFWTGLAALFLLNTVLGALTIGTTTTTEPKHVIAKMFITLLCVFGANLAYLGVYLI